MYKSPIAIFMKQIRMTQDETIVRAVQDVGIFVDKDELIKALQYDRGQYDKGYADGQKDAKEAQNIDPENLRPTGELIDKIASYLERDGNWEALKQCWLIGGRSDELREMMHRAIKEDDA